MRNTIVAIATPAGYGGIGIVRVSGTQALSIAMALTHRDSFRPREATMCTWYTPDGAPIDTGIVLYFKNPHSFTGEDVIEFQGHGSPIALDLLVKACVQSGAQVAKPGEFSLTALLNGKMDLVQAEAIADLIHANSDKAAKMAVQSLQGVFSARIQAILADMTQLRVLVEAMIDFPEEEIEISTWTQLRTRCCELLAQFTQLMHQTKQGSIMREGVSVVIAGPPNAGKSTLMNALAEREVAIVTDIAGTTRDVMRESLLIDGIPLLLIDTAGLRETSCVVEQVGIERARAAMQQADLILWVVDVNQPVSISEGDSALLEGCASDVPMITIFNKIDRGAPVEVANAQPLSQDPSQRRAASVDEKGIYVSAKHGEGLVLIRQAILEKIGYQSEEGVFIARRRHLAALSQAHQYLASAFQQLQQPLQVPLELMAEDLRCAQQALSEITGEFTSDDLLGEIFSSFCIGK